MSKPFFREQTQSWYCSINGNQFSLGKNKTEANEKFYELMGKKRSCSPPPPPSSTSPSPTLSGARKIEAPGTYDNSLKYLGRRNPI